MVRETQIPIQDFEVPIKSKADQELAARLKPAAQMAGALHLLVSPEFYYGQVLTGDINDPAVQDRFKKEFDKRAADNPELRKPHTVISSKWEAVNVALVQAVNVRLRRVSNDLYDTAIWLRGRGRSEQDEEFAKYLESLGTLLPEGRFDEATMAWLRLSADLPVGFFIGPVETYKDPFKIKASFQAQLTITDKEVTRKAAEVMRKFREASYLRYGYTPTDSKVVVANVLTLAGLMGEPESVISAFNLPNDPRLAEEAGNYLIYLFMGRMMEKNSRRLRPALQETLDISCAVWDTISYTQMHEGSHAFRYEGEDLRWGKWRSVGRELWAADRGLVVSSSNLFSNHFRGRVVRGLLGYAVDDIGKFSDRLFEPVGVNQPMLEQLHESSGGDYAPGSYLVLRRAVTEGFLNRASYSIDGITKLAEERDKILDSIAKSGSESDIEKFFNEQLDSTRSYPVNGDFFNQPRLSA